MKRKKPLYLCGPTAVGKSAVAIELAKRLGGEIISVDSMQVYRGMDIGTAKPSEKERRQVPHHLIDVADLTERFDAARFVRLAMGAEEHVIARGKIPIYCGGTGLYFNALLQGLGEAPPSDPDIRRELENTDLALPKSWSPVAQAAVTNGNQVSVTIPTIVGGKFFRLQAQ